MSGWWANQTQPKEYAWSTQQPPDATAGLTEQNDSRDTHRVMDPPDDGAGARQD